MTGCGQDDDRRLSHEAGFDHHMEEVFSVGLKLCTARVLNSGDVMNIRAVIEYWGPGVATFDPGKVLWRLKQQFPEAEIDPTDWAEREVDSLDSFLEQRSIGLETKETMRSQIRGKALRNGPVYRFKLADRDGVAIEGVSSRYCVAFRSTHDIEEAFRQRITDFLQSLAWMSPLSLVTSSGSTPKASEIAR
jgi:hypothetical protein